MNSSPTLEEKVNIPLSDFGTVLRKYDISGFSYPAFYLDGHPAGVIDIPNQYPKYSGCVRIGVFKTREDHEKSVFDIKILSGPAGNITYLEASSKLKKALQSERIHFTDERDIQKCREEAIMYARKLLDVSERL